MVFLNLKGSLVVASTNFLNYLQALSAQTFIHSVENRSKDHEYVGFGDVVD
jgi:hypothetical protein